VVPTARENDNLVWSYTTTAPAQNWMQSDFEGSSWKQGSAGFGTRMTPNTVVRTEWNTPDIWLRREVNFEKAPLNNLRLMVHHDEDFELYINGVLAARRSGFTSDYEDIPLTSEGAKAIKPGRNIVAIHCHQTTGGQYIDAGFARADH
jgi:hypothetical protein